MDGRIDEVICPRQQPNTIYVASATGGVWKSTDAGTTWRAIFDSEPVSSIGAIAVAPSDPSIVWVGTGEANNRQTSSWGDGVYKSTDGGLTWTHMGLPDSYQISRIVIDPSNSQVVYVAVLGNLWDAGGERGLYKTEDGGKSWQRVLHVDDNTGIADVEMDPHSPRTLFAAAYERRRTVYGFNGGGPSSALYKSTDGGASWQKLHRGLPYENGGETGRIGVSIYPRNPQIVYARVEYASAGTANDRGGVYRSTDGGLTWEKRSSLDPRPSYFPQILVDPNNYLRVWLPGGGLAHSDDGGKTFEPDPSKQGLQTIHADFHTVWIDPDDSNYMIAGSDGGVYTSHNAGDTWDYINTIPVGQVYAVATDTEIPYHICGGFQDNGSWCGPSLTRNPLGITNEDWYRVMDGDGFHAVPDPTDANLVFVDAQNGKLIRLNRRTNEWALIRPLEPDLDSPPYRWQWNSPLVATAQGHLYVAANVVFRSTDAGNSWTRISPNLTANADPTKLPILGEMPSKKMIERDYGAGTYPCITSLAVSPLDEQVIWAGTEDGNLQVTRDGGKNWTNVAGAAGLPKSVYVSSVAASHFAQGTVYATFDGHRNGDFGIYVFRSEDYGKSWQRIVNGLPDDRGTAQVIREDPTNPQLLFLGTEFALYASFDRGENWIRLQSNFPSVIVDDIAIEPRFHDLIVATHGRAFWVLDDIEPLEELTPAVLNSDVHLFGMRTAYEWKLFDHSNGYTGDQLFKAENPPYGAIINYYLRQPLAKGQHVLITVTDASGKQIQQFNGSEEAGLNRINWDLRYPTLVKPTADQLGAEYEGFFYNAVQGPFVPPGTYRVQVSVSGEKSSTTVQVEDDPSVEMRAQDRAARDRLMSEAYDLYKQSVDQKKIVTSLKDSLEQAQKHYSKAPEDVQMLLKRLTQQVDKLYERVVGPAEEDFMPLTYTPPPLASQTARLLFSLENVSQAPTAGQQERYAHLDEAVRRAAAELKTLVDSDLPKLNSAMRKAGIPYVPPPSEK